MAAECWRGRGGKLSRILGKNRIFNEFFAYHFINVTNLVYMYLAENEKQTKKERKDLLKE